MLSEIHNKSSGVLCNSMTKCIAVAAVETSSVQTEALYLLNGLFALSVCVYISLCHVVGGLMTTR